MAGKSTMAAGLLEMRLRELERQAKEDKQVLHGNGNRGLVQEVARMKGSVDSIEKSAKTFATTVQQLQRDQTQFVERQAGAVADLRAGMKGLSKTVKIIKTTMTKVQTGLSHITDWRKALTIRVTTIVGVYGGLTAIAYVIWVNRESLVEIFSK